VEDRSLGPHASCVRFKRQTQRRIARWTRFAAGLISIQTRRHFQAPGCRIVRRRLLIRAGQSRFSRCRRIRVGHGLLQRCLGFRIGMRVDPSSPVSRTDGNLFGRAAANVTTTQTSHELGLKRKVAVPDNCEDYVGIQSGNPLCLARRSRAKFTTTAASRSVRALFGARRMIALE